MGTFGMIKTAVPGIPISGKLIFLSYYAILNFSKSNTHAGSFTQYTGRRSIILQKIIPAKERNIP